MSTRDLSRPPAVGLLPLDLNADVGEGIDDEPLMRHLTSVSIACGGHAGDRDSMARALEAAGRLGLRAGAHPSYPDREGFGRRGQEIPPGALEESLVEQVMALVTLARDVGTPVTHVKAHGALYNLAWTDGGTADVVARAAAMAAPGARLFCPPGSAQERAGQAAGMVTVPEGFADRGYDPAGALLPRGAPGAVAGSANGLLRRLTYLRGVPVRTICVHGDNPAALAIARAARRLAERAGFAIGAYEVPA